MRTEISLDPAALYQFSLPHAVRVIGEHQHLIGCGALALATQYRVRVSVEETPDELTVSFFGTMEGDRAGEERETVPLDAQDGMAGRREDWLRAIRQDAPSFSSDTEGLDIRLDLGGLWRACPPTVLAVSPAVCAGLAVAVSAHRGRASSASAAELTERACNLRAAALDTPAQSAGRFYAECLLGIEGGAGYVEPGGASLNVQQLLPPESLALALLPADRLPPFDDGVERNLLEQVARVRSEIGDVRAGDDAALAALFALPDDVVGESGKATLYGLLRITQMAESFVERVMSEHPADNDVLAEICDEESAILADYFGFPDAYAGLRARAAEAGALGVKVTWALGGLPAAVIVAPGRRDGVLSDLRNRMPQAWLLPLNLSTYGLLRAEDEPEGQTM